MAILIYTSTSDYQYEQLTDRLDSHILISVKTLLEHSQQ